MATLTIVVAMNGLAIVLSLHSIYLCLCRLVRAIEKS